MWNQYFPQFLSKLPKRKQPGTPIQYNQPTPAPGTSPQPIPAQALRPQPQVQISPNPKKPLLDFERPDTWYVIAAAVLLLCALSTALIATPAPPANHTATPAPTPRYVIILNPGGTGCLSGQIKINGLCVEPTPTPPRVIPTPRPQSTPRPQPTPAPRWCETIDNHTVCHEGVAPTPIPTPTPTPVPTPTPTPVLGWIKAGLLCEVPDRLLDQRWIVAYRYPCTCSLREQYFPGALDFSPFVGCHQTGAWAQASCDCVGTICQKEKGLC